MTDINQDKDEIYLDNVFDVTNRWQANEITTKQAQEELSRLDKEYEEGK